MEQNIIILNVFWLNGDKDEYNISSKKALELEKRLSGRENIDNFVVELNFYPHSDYNESITDTIYLRWKYVREWSFESD